MKRNLILLLVCLWLLDMVAQQDPVLMKINGKEITRSAFEYLYNKNNTPIRDKRNTPSEYVTSFINFKLKVAAAQTAGLDTTRAVCDAILAYRRQLTKAYLLNEAGVADYPHRLDEKMAAKVAVSRVQVMTIFKSLPQNISSRSLQEAEVRMDSIYAALTNDAQTNFADYVNNYSEDKRLFWVERLSATQEFENSSFALSKGQISKPFFTPQGLHIVKIIDVKETSFTEEVKVDLLNPFAHSDQNDKVIEALVNKLKLEYAYTPHTTPIDELLLIGETDDKILFTLDGHPYTGADFKRFSTSYPQGMKRQWDGFVAKSILDYENSRLEEKHSDFRLALQAYKEELLVSAITSLEVSKQAAINEENLNSYFKANQSNYRWTLPHYKGIVLHATSKKIAKQAKKIVKKLPQEDWAIAIERAFNTPAHQQVKIAYGVFAIGDNKYVDKLVFKQGGFNPLTSYPFTAVLGQKTKGPADYKEVYHKVVADYQSSFDTRWVESLRAANKVEINQEALKTVNNH